MAKRPDDKTEIARRFKTQILRSFGPTVAAIFAGPRLGKPLCLTRGTFLSHLDFGVSLILEPLAHFFPKFFQIKTPKMRRSLPHPTHPDNIDQSSPASVSFGKLSNFWTRAEFEGFVPRGARGWKPANECTAIIGCATVCVVTVASLPAFGALVHCRSDTTEGQRRCAGRA
jgi:hypothetical protein